MKNVHLKAFIYLFFSIFLDMSMPVNSMFSTDFTMLGVIFLSMYIDYRLVILYALFFGITKDALNSNIFPLFSVDFMITVILVKSLLKYLRDKPSFRMVIAFLIIVFNFIFIAALSKTSLSGYFLLDFISSSFILFLVIDYLFASWIQQ